MPTAKRSDALRRVFVAWQNPTTRQWYTIARLARRGDEYEFSFTQGATKVARVVQHLFNSGLDEHYISSGLISLFKNKIPSKSRSDFKKLSRWLDLTGDETEFEMLGKFGLIPGSDGLLVYPEPVVDEGKYSIEFFLHGIRHAHGSLEDRHLHGDVLRWCETVMGGEQLFPLLDVGNQHDPNCIGLRAGEGTVIVGYVPRFYSSDLKAILSSPERAAKSKFEVLKNNDDAPLQFRMLCRFEADVEPNFRPLDDVDHAPRSTLVPLSA
ncbi:hypothetical protein IVB45_20820 [Bradyrhizobium sp. 4]|uniref:hypothetical protein n=1 Tax=unclassified Bradyrhizobium TaxID=2631580 RepID=UPI001FFB24B0|nr:MULTISPECIES: hypothetical protein [unclassified Bradyrhizobium]MCK1402345.1 hypothetical protein [Bradyrhizobium sp. 39]MCK1747940.1 hypothetical protein [Bradyrhizobium sp. 135]UPJ32433.1 hypothetical protein IVB45_20820 [Bradyrhizobium sp. 4]